MNIPSQITVSINPEVFQSGPKRSLFRPGSTLRLKVLELRGDRALIDFGNFRATADIKIPVAQGQELLVKVQASGKQLKLSVANPGSETNLSMEPASRQLDTISEATLNGVQKDIKQILNQVLTTQSFKNIPSPILNVLEGLNTHFEIFDLKKLIAHMMPRLQFHVDHSGIFFEKMLETVIARLMHESENTSSRQLAKHPDVQNLLARDLKANLLILRNFVENEGSLQKFIDSRALAAMRKAVDFLLADITGQQGRAVKQLDSPDPFQVFTYALPLEAEKQAAKLKIFYQKKQRSGSKPGFQISLLLSMDRLGSVRADFYLLENDLKITFFVEDQSTKAKIQENCPQLKNLLSPYFDQMLVRAVVSEKKINEFDHEDQQTASNNRVDVRI